MPLPIETGKYIGQAISDSYERDMINGDAESRAHWVSYALGTVASSVISTKGAGAITKTGAETMKLGAKQIGNSVKNVELPNLLPYYPRNQLATAGPTKPVPYSVVDGKFLKEQMIVKAQGYGSKNTNKYQVGAYKDIKGVEGLDAHHAGQKAVMKKLVDNYDLNTAPATNVPKVGHTIKGPNGIVSRSTNGIDDPRQLLARDILELRRVYDDISNSELRMLIELNKKMYPEMRK